MGIPRLEPKPLGQPMAPKDERALYSTPFKPFVYTPAPVPALKPRPDWISGRAAKKLRELALLRQIKKRRKNRRRNEHRKSQEAIKDRLRWMPYREYLRTPHWHSIRRALFKQRGHKCEACGRRASREIILDVHHLTYERRGRELLSDLKILCRQCHMDEHERSEPAA